MRSAKPVLAEGRCFARYMDQAADGFFRLLLGRRAEEVMATAYLQPQHSLSYQHVIFAEQSGEFVGMTSAYTGKQARSFSELPLFRAAGTFPIRLKCMHMLLTPVFRILSTLTDEDFYLQGIAVEPGLRGEGIGSILMDDVEQRAAASGSNRLCLDVAAGNTGARRLYARRGMFEVSKWPDTRILPPLFIRMAKSC